MSNCEKNASNDSNAAHPAPRLRAAAASPLHAMPDDSAQLIKIQENVSYRLFISSELSLFVSMGLFESLNSESGRLGADGALQRGRG